MPRSARSPARAPAARWRSGFGLALSCWLPVLGQRGTCTGGETAACSIDDGPERAAARLGADAEPANLGGASRPLEPRSGRPCACEYTMPSAEVLRACFARTNTSLRTASSGQAEGENRVFAMMRQSRRIESSSRFAASLSGTHLAAYGHMFHIERQEDEYRGGKLHLTSLKEDRLWQVQSILRKLRDLQKQRKKDFAWLLWLDHDAAVVSSEDVLRQALSSKSVSKRTHVITSSRARTNKTADSAVSQASGASPGKVLDSGVVLLRNAEWTEGFLKVWHQELFFTASELSDDLDDAFGRAVKKTRDLGGASAAIELPDIFRVSYREDLHAAVAQKEHPIIHLKDALDEVADYFFHSAWTFACRRPFGLEGVSLETFKRFHREAHEKALESMVGIKRRKESSSGVLHLRGQKLEQKILAEATVDALAEHAPASVHLAATSSGGKARKAAADAERLLRLAMVGYQYVLGKGTSKVVLCEKSLDKLYSTRGHQDLRASGGRL